MDCQKDGNESPMIVRTDINPTDEEPSESLVIGNDKSYSDSTHMFTIHATINCRFVNNEIFQMGSS
jgi:hypothetical protein